MTFHPPSETRRNTFPGKTVLMRQGKLHAWCQQRTAVEYCHKHGIVVEAYSPLVRNQKADDPTLVKLAEKHGKSGAQILIRYCLQKNWVPLPKSDTPARIEENADVYDFELSDEDMKSLDDLDQGDQGAIGMTLCFSTLVSVWL